MTNAINSRIVKIISSMVLVLIFAFCFIPVVPIDVFTGTFEETTNKAIYITEYKAFYTVLYKYAKDILYFWPFIMTAAFFLFLFGIILSLVFLVVDKTKQFLISFSITTIVLVPYVFAFDYGSVFALIVFVICLLMLLLNILVAIKENQTQLQNKSKIELAINLALAKQIKSKRVELKMTQKEVAEKTFMSRSLISKIESGKVTISKNHLEQLSTCLGDDIKEGVKHV